MLIIQTDAVVVSVLRGVLKMDNLVQWGFVRIQNAKITTMQVSINANCILKGVIRMTIDEALKILDTIPTIGDQVDALEMAIKALEQGEVLQEIWQEITNLVKKYPFVSHMDAYVKEDDVLEIIVKHIKQIDGSDAE